MTRVIFLIFSLFFLNHCSFNENSRIWKDKQKKLEPEKNIKKVFSEEKKISSEFNKKLNIFRKDVNNFNRLNQNMNKDLQNKLLNNKSNFLKLIKPILLNYVDDNNITYLLQKKYIIVGHNDLNKTSDIIKLVDKKINISNFNDSISK